MYYTFWGIQGCFLREKSHSCISHHELDTQPTDLLHEQISPVFNDEIFKPPVVHLLSGVINRDYLIGIDPVKMFFDLGSSFLNSKFAKL